jgi:hypothetical protein
MRTFTRAIIFFIILLVTTMSASAQSQPQDAKEPTGSITGRITVGGKAAQGVIVTLTQSDADQMKTMAGLFGQKSTAKTTTDEEGRYRFSNIAAGRYSLNPFAPALVAPIEPGAGWPPGRIVNVGDGEAVEKVDFALTRGGVITGRITDAQGRPVVGQIVMLSPTDENAKSPQAIDPFAGSPLGKSMYMTDDRGIYRVYGMAAGRYLVSFGIANAGGVTLSLKRSYHAQTFHPGVTDKAKATIVEVKEGGEATGVDIRLGLPSQTYKASGRVVDAATGKPAGNAVVNYGAVGNELKIIMPHGLGALANSRGEFQLDSIAQGRYYAFASFDEGSESYSDSTPFEITSGDVTGLVVKVHRGLTVSGIISIEGTDDPATLASLTQIQVNAYVTGPDATAPRNFTARVAADGAFSITGLQPGMLHIYINRFFVPTKLAVLRIERNGIRQQGGLQINAGESLADVRIVLANANCALRGQIKVTGDASLEDAILEVAAHRTGEDNLMSTETSEVDQNGRFAFKDLLPGDYEITVYSLKPGNAQGKDKPVLARQNVTVMNDTEANVTLTVDLGGKKDKGQ